MRRRPEEVFYNVLGSVTYMVGGAGGSVICVAGWGLSGNRGASLFAI